MKILLACDGSEHSEAALDEAVSSPWPTPCEFKVVSVVDNSEQKKTDSAQQLIDRALVKLRQRLKQAESVEGQVLIGYPKSEILKTVERWPCDLLIVGSRGFKGLKRLVMGSVSHALLLAAGCSIRIARRNPAADGSKRVVVSLDESEFSDHVVSRVASRPWTDGTEILCVTAVPSLTQYVHVDQDIHEVSNLEALRKEQVETAETHLEKVTETLRAKLPNVKSEYQVLDGDPREEVIDVAHRWGARLIVTGCKGKNWVDRVLIGSVSEAIATWADCSVEVVKR